MIETKRKFYTILILEVASVLLIILMGIIPLFKKIQKSHQELIFQQKALMILDLRTKEFAVFQKKLALFNPVLQKLQKVFVEKDAPIGFIEFLERFAKEFDVSLKITPFSSKKEEYDLWEPLVFEIVMGGRFQDCFKMLRALEKNPYLTEIFFANAKVLTDKDLRHSFLKDLKPGDVVLSLRVKVFAKNNGIED